MQVTLEALKPNPTRDFHVDPMIELTIENLEQSIKQDGFWGGVVCRENAAGEIEIAAGHHRVAGAIRAGVKTADLFVSKDMDEVGLIRIYARENATQRGNSATAQVGTVASALRYLAKSLLVGATREIPSSTDVGVARQRLTDSRGLGEPIITGFLANIPGVNENSVRQQLSILKSSGDYSRIIDEVVAEIEFDNAAAIIAMEEADRQRVIAEQQAVDAEEARKAAAVTAKATKDADEKLKAAAELEKAEASKAEADRVAAAAKTEAEGFSDIRNKVGTARRARAKANGTKVTFDLEGVSKVFVHVGLLETFRKEATSHGISPYLPVKAQAKLARGLLKLAKDTDSELTSRFISENIASLVHNAKVTGRELKRTEKAALLKTDWNKQTSELQHQIGRQASGMLSLTKKLAKHDKKRPSGVTFHALPYLKLAIKNAKEALNLIGEMV
jgi:ParB-like chromosome segregation protein Spo0J